MREQHLVRPVNFMEEEQVVDEQRVAEEVVPGTVGYITVLEALFRLPEQIEKLMRTTSQDGGHGS